MATDFWIASGAGNWATTADWSTGSVPGQSDDVVIGSSSSATTVTSTGGVTINTLNITPNDELSINGEVNGVFSGSFNLINGMPEGNFGTLDLEDAGFHVFGGTINNSGLILVKANQSSGGSFLFLADNGGGTVTLNGAGMVVLDGNDQTLNAVIQGEGGRAPSNLINDDNNISGTGTVGVSLNIINHGTFETNNFLELGTMQIVGSAGGGSFDNENLLIADPNGVLILGMDGQTSKIINNDLIELENSVQGTQSIIEIAGTLTLQNHEVLGLGSNIAGNVIVGGPGGIAAELILDGGTLAGVGRLGGNNLTLFIEALTYVVCASGTMTIDTGATTIQPTGVLEAINGSLMEDFTPNIANQGTIAALNGGVIDVNGNIANSNGGVVNIGANSKIMLEEGFVVSGTIQFTGSNATLATATYTSGISTQTTVSGTGTGDSFYFSNIYFFPGEHAIFQQNGGTGTLSVVNSSGVTITSVTLAGQYTSADFTVIAGSQNDVLVKTNLAPPTPPANAINDLITELYIGYYNRAPDPSGETYWVTQLAGGMSLSAIAQSYSVQTESTALYPFLANPNTSSTAAIDSFIAAIYQNLFGRAPDAAGQAYYVQQLQNGQNTVGGTIIAIESGAQGNDLLVLANKLTVGDYFDTQIFNNNVQFSQSVALAALAAVTSSASSITTAEALVNTYVATAPHAAQAATSSQAAVNVVGVSPSHDLAIAA
jgi:hypothetical protein